MKSLWAFGRGQTEKPETSLSFRDQVNVLLRVLPLLWPKGRPLLKLRTLTAGLLIVAAKLVNVAVPILYKLVVDALTGETTAAAVSVPFLLIAVYGITRLAAQATGEIRDLIFIRVHGRALRLVSVDVFRHLHTLSLRFHLDRQMGGLSRAVERGCSAIEFMLAYLLTQLLPTIFELVLVAGVIWHYFNFTLAATTLIVILCFSLYTGAGTQWRMKFRREMNAMEREANARAVDSLLNYETVKYFGNEEHESERYDEAKKKFVDASVSNQRSLTVFNIGQATILSLGIVIVMTLAAYDVANRGTTIGDFVMVNAYLLQVYGPLNLLGWVYRNLRQSMIDIEQMYNFLRERPEVADKENAAALVPGPGRLVFDRVSFRYDERRPILNDVSFEIPPGKTVAIVGPTGSGKTTVARLLFRFYDPQSGSISIDGQDLRDVTQASLRRAIGVVPQDAVLFNDTLAYNIAYGKVGATEDEIREAARRAHLSKFIEKLPDGLDTRVGERGLKLSGGEKQRVAIARVVLKNPEILIFDEATSSLDSHTEHEIIANLREVSAQRTTLVIAHRLSTVVHADEIVVLDEGRIVERGPHEALVARGGIYAGMWNRQLRNPDADSEDLAEVAE